MTWRGAGIGSYRYGSCVLWTVEGDLAGSAAERFSGRVDLFFESGEPALLVDLRGAGSVDSVGAAALARLCAKHPGLEVIGRPGAWDDFPLPVRRQLGAICAAADLPSALAPRGAAAAPERRRDPRIPLQLPVELFFGGRRAAAELLDISRGGVRLHVPGLEEAALRDGETFAILGLEEDPLGRELAGAAPAAVCAARVAGQAVGARFAGTPPPV